MQEVGVGTGPFSEYAINDAFGRGGMPLGWYLRIAKSTRGSEHRACTGLFP